MKSKNFTCNDVDGAYLLGVFNSVGLDGLGEEIKRLKKIGIMPNQLITMLKTKSASHQVYPLISEDTIRLY